MDIENLIKNLILENLNVEVLSIQSISGGQVGFVYKVETSNTFYLVKFVKKHTELIFEQESFNDRVYSSRWSNFLPAYKILEKDKIKIPKVYAFGCLEEENLNYEILEYLEGDADDFSVNWFSAVGDALGSIHKISRSYQGWVDMEKPYKENWSSAFYKSLDSQLEQVKDYFTDELYLRIKKYIDDSCLIKDPDKFVFSHTDGFQGILKKKDNSWVLLGVIDIEDHQFTDQRFVLTGFELSHLMENRNIPNEFWDAYLKHVDVDESFYSVKNIFQIYYLLVWSRVLKNEPILFKKCVAKLSELISQNKTLVKRQG